GRAARILQIGDVAGPRGGEVGVRGLNFAERFPITSIDKAPGGRRLAYFGELAREEEQLRIAAAELDLELVDVRIAAAEARRQRERNGPGTGIDRTEEAGRELDPGFGNQRNSITRSNAEGDEAARKSQRILAQLGIRISAGQAAARVVEVQPASAIGRIVERIAEGREIREPPGLAIDCRSRARRGKAC